MASSKLGRQLESLLGKTGRQRACRWPFGRWLSRVATLILFAAIALLFVLMLCWFPTRGLLVVLFLLFLAFIGLVC